MSREIARAIIEEKLGELRPLSYAELAGRAGAVRCGGVTGPDGHEYQVETEVRWDGKSGGNIRAIVAADGPGVSAFRPLTGAFIMRADGSLLEEDTN
ncbi:MAG TPA: hypothetical protein VKS24_05390 [Bradyrhizobium sp.]|nr:hypothetical protein [Bradyrhizobium sp.]